MYTTQYDTNIYVFGITLAKIYVLVTHTCQPQLSIVAGVCLQQLASLLLSVAENPRQPYFAYYLFESIAAAIKQCEVGEAERQLFPAFNIILQQDVQVSCLLTSHLPSSHMLLR
jgi:hypothetical protein